MNHINPEVAGLVESALDAQLQSNATWAKAAEANEQAGGDWHVTFCCLRAAGLTSEDFYRYGGVQHHVFRNWFKAIGPPSPMLRSLVFGPLLAAIVQDRDELERRHKATTGRYEERKAG